MLCSEEEKPELFYELCLTISTMLVTSSTSKQKSFIQDKLSNKPQVTNFRELSTLVIKF